MRNRFHSKWYWSVLLAAAAAPCTPRVLAQDAPQNPGRKTSPSPVSSQETEPELPFRRFSFGLQVRYFPFKAFDGKAIATDESAADTAASYDTTTTSSRFGVGPAVDANLSKRWTIRAETFFEHLQYTKVTEEFTGGTVISGTVKTTLTEHTKSGYWDFPVVARYHFRSRGPVWLNSFVEGGAVLRHLTTVRSGNDTLNSDGTTAYNENPALPAHRNVAGFVVGAGYRMIDDFNFKLVPEIRYTYWLAPTFDFQSTHSSTGQLEIGLSLVR